MSRVKSLTEKLLTGNSKAHKEIIRARDIVESLFNEVVVDSDEDTAVLAALEIVDAVLFSFIENYAYEEE